MSEEQVNGLGDVLTKIITTFIDKPNQIVGELNLEEASKTSSIEPTPTMPAQPLDSALELRTMVNECVREVIEQLFKSGSLVSYDSQRVHNTIGQMSAQAVRPMIDYSQTTNIPMIEEIEKPVRTVAREPRGPGQWDQVEQRLLQVWSELLQISPDSIGTDDNFFELGGDSIVAMQMVGAARDDDLALTVATIFKYPTFADMAAVLRANASQVVQNTSNTWGENEAREARSQAIQNAMYQRYSLLEAANVDAFLQENICPKVRAFRGGIADVFPVTDFQALAVTGTLMSSKWMLNYFYLEGEGSLDLRRLKDVISQVVASFDILRTVFVPYGNRFFQVVLRKLQPTFSVHDTDDLSEFTSSLQDKDRECGPRPGESYLQFAVAKQRGSDKHRIIMRLSHAQYDGLCLPRILGALQAGFRGAEIASTPPFSTYVRDSVRTTTDDHYLYWKDLMRGSSMTEVVQRRGPNYNRGNEAPIILKRTVEFNSLASQRITSATVIKAAWSLVLAQLAGSSDIVFGNVISGRNAAVVGVESIIGPCVNLIPVRVSFKDGWKIMDLLKHIQDQQVANMPYESLGFREIIKHCTDWPDWMNFSTVCQHQNIEKQTGMELAGNEYTLGAIGSQEDLADLTVLSTPQGDDSIEISLVFTSNTGVTLALANQLFESLCEIAITFTTDSMAPLPKPTVLSALLNRTLRQDIATMNPEYRANLNNLSHEEVTKYSAFLRNAWGQILWNKDAALPNITLESSFYDLGGDIIGLAQLSSLLDSEGYQMRVEELVDCPVFGEQVALVALVAKTKRDMVENELREMRAPAFEAETKKKGGFGKALGKSVWGLRNGIKKLRKA
ncbi:uncharacterized protein BP5553_00198 [Venustampulla echinocandica]|uniref:Carrier domain-containing protein n=1 Tax=Venustampulla echinocandica TaxID=2656787 RepID=A0A370TXJ3_9HELO|nr:uncharacterized protein BP5553_00198 [Venustampulla echinocandica]RDL40219.1 hypothetical protein BP5553_00198 [Venustampulla echinocandica]